MPAFEEQLSDGLRSCGEMGFSNPLYGLLIVPCHRNEVGLQGGMQLDTRVVGTVDPPPKRHLGALDRFDLFLEVFERRLSVDLSAVLFIGVTFDAVIGVFRRPTEPPAVCQRTARTVLVPALAVAGKLEQSVSRGHNPKE